MMREWRTHARSMPPVLAANEPLPLPLGSGFYVREISKKSHVLVIASLVYKRKIPISEDLSLAGQTGFEPATFSVTGRRDNRASLLAPFLTAKV